MKQAGQADGRMCKVRWVGRSAVVEVHGKIDLDRSADFQLELMAVLELEKKPERMVIDLGDVPYMDSSGVASLIKLLMHARKIGTDIVLVAMNPRVRSVFEITRLDTVFTILPTEKEALA